MKKLLRILAVAVLGVGLTTGLAAAQTGTIEETGPNSNNEINVDNRNDVDLRNRNDVDGSLNASQDASSGNARVLNNTTGGDATSGDADNDADVEADVFVANASASDYALNSGNQGNDLDATIETTGPNSNNEINVDNRNDVDVNNNNDVDVNVSTTQSADTGNAVVRNNTTGGDATSGDASNNASQTLNVEISN